MSDTDLEKLIAKNSSLKFSSMKIDKHGHYVKGKLSENGVWVNLNIAKNDEQYSKLQQAIDDSVGQWLKNGKSKEYIEVNSDIFKNLIEQDVTFNE